MKKLSGLILGGFLSLVLINQSGLPDGAGTKRSILNPKTELVLEVIPAVFQSNASPLSSALDENGKLVLGTDISGSFNAQGYSMIADPGQAPRFVPLSAGKMTMQPTADGDEYWDDRFYIGEGVDQNVPAVAVSGSDVYIGGSFTTAGGIPANYIAKWNGVNWSTLGSGLNNDVSAIVISGSDVYVGGNFTYAGDVAASRIAKWDGTSWSALGSGVNSYINSLAVLGTDIYAGGSFTTAGGISANYIAKWNGTNWLSLGTGLNNYVNALAVTETDIYAGGSFTTAGGVSANYIAKWDGTNWSALGSGLSTSVEAIAEFSGVIYAGGNFTTAGGVSANRIAKWDGINWSALGSGLNNYADAIAILGSDIYVGGGFTKASEVFASYITMWDGTNWAALGPHEGLGLNTSAIAVAVSGNDVFVGGSFTSAGNISTNRIAKWNGTNWSALGDGTSNAVCDISVSGSDVYAGGLFTTAGGVSANYIAKWDGTEWSSLGSGLDGFVLAVAVNGSDVYAGGYFTTAGGVSANHIAKWDGTNWSALGSGINGDVEALALSGEDLYVGGQFTTAGGVSANYIAKWNGTNWSALGSGLNGIVSAIGVSGSDVYVGGSFTTAGGVSANYIAKWDGANWSSLGTGLSSYADALVVSGSDIYAGGFFGTAGGIAVYYIAKWDGTNWSAMGSGLNYYADDIAVSGDDVYIAGAFATAGSKASNHFAHWNDTLLTISGTITANDLPLSDVAMSGLPGDPITDSSGNYSDTVSSGWSGTVTPTLTNYTFTPASRTYVNITSNATSEDYAAAVVVVTYTISGTVTDGTNPLAGVVMNGLPGNPATDASGAYTGTVDYGWDGTVTPTLAGYTFTPVNRSYTDVAADQTSQDYAATLLTYVISGTVTAYGHPLSGVTISGLTGNPVSDASGAYTATVNYGFTGTATPALAGYTFTPATIDYSNVTADQTSQDYTAASTSELPALEREALVALYDSTTGDSWTNNSGWKTSPLHTDGFALPGTEGTWFGIKISGGHVSEIELYNNLNGNIPQELGNLSQLKYLYLWTNQLSGTIPPQLGNLANLERLHLEANQLTGSIPAELGSLGNLQRLILDRNQLSGTIPSELGNMTNLATLWLSCNKLTGNIPATLVNLSTLTDGGANIGYNALYATDADLVTFLNSKDPDWAATQTIAPANVEAAPASSNTVNLTWDAIPYTGNSGGYRIYLGTELGGPYTFVEQTADKTVTSATISGLAPGTPYYFVIQTRTDAHTGDADYLNRNTNVIDSEYSAEATTSTLPVHTVTFIEGANGTISGTKVQVVDHGSSTTAVEAEGNTGYHFTDWTGDHTGTENPLTITNVTADMTVTANFSLNTYTISGTVTDGTNPLAGVVMNGLPGNPATDASGAYTGTVDYGWDGTVTPTLAGYTFSPATRTYADVAADASGQDYAGTLLTYAISGTVKAYNVALSGVTISGLTGNPVTDASGNYTATVNYGFTGTATPTKTGYTFTPATIDYSNVTADQTSQDYTAASTSELPALERAALIAFYNSTNGDSWFTHLGWKDPPLYSDGFAMPGTEKTWIGIAITSGHVTSISLTGYHISGTIPVEIGNLTRLQGIYLANNQITGAIPAEFGNLTSLHWCSLNNNQISGSMPNEIGNLTGLYQLYLSSNQITGDIPHQIGNLTSLQLLEIEYNKLTGSIPIEIGNMTGLRSFKLNSNKLTGSIPIEIGNMTSLQALTLGYNQLTGPIPTSLSNRTGIISMDIGYNGLYSTDPALTTFLNSKDPDWATTQTIAPANVMATAASSNTVNLTWDAIAYTGDTGGYRIYMGTESGGPYTFVEQTADKTVTSATISGLAPGTPYYFVIQTRTDAHGAQVNTVDSEYSAEATTSTLPVHTVTFIEGANGTISGMKVQVVDHGSSTTAVEAEGNTGYHFTDWTGDHNGTENPLTITNVTADMTVTANFAINTYTISGTVTDGTNPLAGVVMNGLPGNPATDASGAYTGTVDYGWDGTVTPTLAGYTFTPVNRSYTDVAADQTSQNYVASIDQFTISGNVNDGTNPLSVVEMLISTGGSVTTDASGNYSFTQNYGWSGTVTPLKTGYTFAPVSRDYLAVHADQTTQDYAATLNIYAISGTVTVAGAALAGADVTFTNGISAVQTDGTGFYNQNVPHGWSGTVTLSKTGYSFAPTSTIYTNVMADQTNQDYAATSLAALTVTSPNGHESWAPGTTHAITWTQNYLVDTVAIKLYKGGMYKSTLGTVDASAGTFEWEIRLGQALGRDYKIRIHQGVVGDYSDADFSIVRSPADFDRNGLSDVLWRLYETGGKDRVWMVGPIVAAAGLIGESEAQVEWVEGELVSPEAVSILQTVNLKAEVDLNWQIVGTGDFNNDGKADILWRKSDTGANRVWLMNGTTFVENKPLQVWAVLTWEIVGTGDFDDDGKVDILWRNKTTGANRVWLMDGTTLITAKGVAILAETKWIIGGVGDFNLDGKPDIVWRNEYTGENKVWMMNGTAKLREQALPPFTVPGWELAGVGDFNGDGKPDLVWRYTGSGGQNRVWLMNGCVRLSIEALPAETNPKWKIEN